MRVRTRASPAESNSHRYLIRVIAGRLLNRHVRVCERAGRKRGALVKRAARALYLISAPAFPIPSSIYSRAAFLLFARDYREFAPLGS
jgi:hypothetical protein